MVKKHEMKTVIDGLKQVKIAKLESKELRTKVFKTFMKLLGEQKKYDEEYEKMRTAFLSANKDEQEVVVGLQQKLNFETNREKAAKLVEEINSHKDYLDASKLLNEEVEKLGKEEIEIPEIDMDEFMEEYMKQDYELSVVEAIYPMFNVKTE